MARISRRDVLLAEAGDDHDASATASAHSETPAPVCPCCGMPVTLTADGGPGCGVCGYPDNNAAWVDYDGCC